jgi:hypothetical protein
MGCMVGVLYGIMQIVLFVLVCWRCVKGYTVIDKSI